MKINKKSGIPPPNLYQFSKKTMRGTREYRSHWRLKEKHLWRYLITQGLHSQHNFSKKTMKETETAITSSKRNILRWYGTL